MAYSDECVSAGFQCPALLRFSNADQSYEDLRAMVARANTWRTEGLNEDGDINADGMIDE